MLKHETADGTAVERSDYRESEGTVTFFGDVLTRTVLIPLIGDSEPENSEEFTVTISNPVSPMPSRFPVLEGGKIIGPVYLPLAIAGTGSAQVTIIDGSSPSEGEAEPWADITSDNPDPFLRDRVKMTARVVNGPEGTPTYRWQRLLNRGWVTRQVTGDSMTVRFSSPGTRTYRVIAIYPGEPEITSNPFSLTW